MHADLDTLVVALYVTVDELLGPRRGPGRPPKLSDAELVCLAVAQVLLGFHVEHRWIRFATHPHSRRPHVTSAPIRTPRMHWSATTRCPSLQRSSTRSSLLGLLRCVRRV